MGANPSLLPFSTGRTCWHCYLFLFVCQSKQKKGNQHNNHKPCQTVKFPWFLFRPKGWDDFASILAGFGIQELCRWLLFLLLLSKHESLMQFPPFLKHPSTFYSCLLVTLGSITEYYGLGSVNNNRLFLIVLEAEVWDQGANIVRFFVRALFLV